MNHFTEILNNHDEVENHEDGNIFISETIDETESFNCRSRKQYSNSKYKKLANVSFAAISFVVTPCLSDSVPADNKYSSQIKSEKIYSCSTSIDKYSIINNIEQLSEEDQISVAPTYSDDFYRMPPKKSITINTKVRVVLKGRPSRI